MHQNNEVFTNKCFSGPISFHTSHISKATTSFLFPLFLINRLQIMKYYQKVNIFFSRFCIGYNSLYNNRFFLQIDYVVVILELLFFSFAYLHSKSFFSNSYCSNHHQYYNHHHPHHFTFNHFQLFRYIRYQLIPFIALKGINRSKRRSRIKSYYVITISIVFIASLHSVRVNMSENNPSVK